MIIYWTLEGFSDIVDRFIMFFFPFYYWIINIDDGVAYRERETHRIMHIKMITGNIIRR